MKPFCLAAGCWLAAGCVIWGQTPPRTGPSSAAPAGSGVSPADGSADHLEQGREHRLEDAAARARHLQPGRRRRQDLSHLLHAATTSPASGGEMDDLQAAPRLPRPRDRQDRLVKDVTPRLPEQATHPRRPRLRLQHAGRRRRARLRLLRQDRASFAFDLDGKQLWQADVGDGLNGWGSAASPVLYGDLVIVNASVESESLVGAGQEDRQGGLAGPGHQARRGTRRSSCPSAARRNWSSAMLRQGARASTRRPASSCGRAPTTSPGTSCRAWWPPTASSTPSAAGPASSAVAVKAGGRGDVTRTHRLWTSTKGSNVSSPIVHDGHLYWMNDNKGTAYCAEARTGKVVYEERVERAAAGVRLAAPGRRQAVLPGRGRAGRSWCRRSRSSSGWR